MSHHPAQVQQLRASVGAPSVAPKQGRELRAAPRVDCNIDCDVVHDGVGLTTLMRDISASGAAIDMSRALELGEVLSLSFGLPDSPEQRIRCAGLVRSYRQTRDTRIVGVEFHNIVGGSRQAIAGFVRRRLAGEEPADRLHWEGGADLGEAYLVGQAEKARPILRWAPGLAALFAEVADHIMARETVFVPVDPAGLSEGERIYLEVVPPSSHAVFRMLGEVVWVQADQRRGLGLRLGGLSPMDSHLIRATLRYFQAEADRYR